MTSKSKWMWVLLCVGLMSTALYGCGGSQDAGNSAGTGDHAASGETDGEDSSTAADTGDETGAASDEDNAVNGENVSETDAEGIDMTDASEMEAVDLEGTALSILGDSLSTFEGWIPNECTNFFPGSGELTDVSETWWMQLLDDTGMELCSNNSSAGSTCVGDSLLTGEVKYGCSGDRLSLLTGSQGKMPDIIIVYMGTNDLMNGVPIGDNDGTKLVEEGEIDNFSDAYTLILDKLSSEYPAAQIYCCGLHQVGDWGKTQPFVFLTNHLGLTAEDYSKQIQIIADNKGVPYIDLYHCGIEIDNLDQMTSDGVHFTPLGMGYVKEAVFACLTGNGNK